MVLSQLQYLGKIVFGGESEEFVEVLSELFAHAAVDGQVERTGEAHEAVDHQHNVVGDFIIEEDSVLKEFNLTQLKAYKQRGGKVSIYSMKIFFCRNELPP